MGMGNNVLAKDHAGQAVNLDPGNPQYRQLLNQLEWNSQRYQNNPYGGGYGGGSQSCGTGNCAVTCGVRIAYVNVWEEIFVHACKG